MKSALRLLRLARSDKGNVLVLVAVAAMMVVVSTGAAVDMARAQVLQMQMQSALDAAGLAAGANANTINVQTEAQKYFNANFPAGYLGASPVTLVATLGGVNNNTVTLTAHTTQSTTFMQAVGITSVSVNASTQITISNAGMELVLVLDNTGSMATVLPGDSLEKIQALKNSITGSGALLDTLYGINNNTAPNLWVGVVPFTDMVNIGSGHPTWMDTTFDSALDFGPTVPTSSGGTCPTYGGISGTHLSSGSSSRCYYTPLASEPTSLANWGGCVLARSSTYEGTDTVPSASTSGTLYQAYNYATSSSSVSSSTTCNGGGGNAWMCHKSVTGGTEYVYDVTSATTGPNLNCVATPVQQMVAEKATIVSEVNSMVAGGSTMINLGVGWGYRMLSPNWAGLWGGEMNATGNTQFPVLPLPYRTPLMSKVLILMTDGMNSPPGSTTGSAYQGQSSVPTVNQLDTWTENVCDALKSNGVIIYTIGFGTTDNNDPNNATSVNGPLLKYCATQLYSGDTSHYFLATSSIILSNVFGQIAGQLANLRVSQ